MRTLPLGVRIVALVVPLALLPIAFVGGMAYYYLEDAIRAEATTRELQMLDDGLDLVNASLDQAARVAEAVATLLGGASQDAGGGERPQPEEAAIAPSVQLSFTLSPSVHRIAILRAGASPIVLGTRTAARPAADNPMNLPAFDRLAAPGRLAAGTGGTFTVFVLHPVERGRRLAQVAVEVDARWLRGALADMARAAGGVFFVVDDEGRVLVGSDDATTAHLGRLQAALSRRAVPGPMPLPPDEGNGSDVYYGAQLGEFRRAGAAGTVTLYLVRRTQRGALIDRIADLRSTAALLSGAALAMGLVGAGLIARTVVHPLNALLGMTGRIAGGHFDVRLKKGRDDEIGRLVDAFNGMAASLETFRDRLVDAESFAAIGRVSSTLAHEVRNPLNAMRGCVDYLRLKRPDDPVVTHHAGIIAEEIAELDRFVRDFLRVARVERPVLGPVDLHALLESRLQLHEAASLASHVKTTRDFAATRSVIPVDAQQMAMVFENLINNAIEAMPGGGTLSVSTADGPLSLRVEVRDTGLGIAPELTGRVGTPFFTTKAGGTGLGLAISRRVVEAHGGRLWFETRHGAGAVFQVELPHESVGAGESA
ncbi:MAG: ATP-binding protein [Acidobacteriota bacterium]